VRLRVPAQSWRGRGASLRLGRGDLTVELPALFNADIDAKVLRAGRVENNHPAVVQREPTTTPEKQLRARAGAGGATLAFEIGDGVIRINKVTSDN